ncbi:MAG TPA: caspase family protein [Thermoanaerobaculia bacterium]|nr:caspase family protein [Thermoanaerobaculia bacterium]
MIRAAVLIGVEKTGSLPKLQAVRTGVEEMRQWALAQPGMGARVVTLTDAQGELVTSSGIRKAIKDFVDSGMIEQLIVYFAGHGVNNAYHEFWLLSEAPEDPNAAVNVDGSASLARHCGVPHVVLISDACRTAADSIQAQAVEGSLVFPNTGPAVEPGCVDIFYAAAVGRPALEVKDINASAAGFRAVYTTALVDGLEGSRTELIQVDGEPDEGVGRIRPWPLKRYLQAEVPKLLTQMGVALGVSQLPDAVITSEPEAWIAEVPFGGAAPAAVTRGGTRRGGPTREGLSLGEAASGQATLRSASQHALGAMLHPTRTRSTALDDVEQLPGGGLFSQTLRQVSAAPILRHFETRCGFQVRGIAVEEAASSGGVVELLDGPGGVVRISEVSGPATNVLLTFADGHGALLPAIPDFIATLTYEDGELVNVTYEPSDNTPRWADLQGRLSELRELRGMIASAARLGVFRLERKEDAAALVDRMRAVKGVDPTMAVYAAYALDERGQRRDIEDMERFLRDDLRLSLFDVALLAQPPKAEPALMPADVFPAVPLLSQGWALLDAYGVALPPPLRGLRRHAVDSLWTLFDSTGLAAVRAAVHSGEVP